jgi:tetratricopeptide (TPR) repeat protein
MSSAVTPGVEGRARREHVFVSYSHEDRMWLDRLVTILRPLVRQGELKLWSDFDIRPGDRWNESIHNALDSCCVAVLLVSSDFLASEFIAHTELPAVLHAAESEGVRIVWIAVSSCLYEKTALAPFKAANEPARPLDLLSEGAQQEELVRIARLIAAAAAEARSRTAVKEATGSGDTAAGASHGSELDGPAGQEAIESREPRPAIPAVESVLPKPTAVERTPGPRRFSRRAKLAGAAALAAIACAVAVVAYVSADHGSAGSPQSGEVLQKKAGKEPGQTPPDTSPPGGATAQPPAAAKPEPVRAPDVAAAKAAYQNGLDLLKNKDYTGALTQFESAIQSAPDFAPAQEQRCVTTVEHSPDQNRFFEGVAVCERAVKLNPSSARASLCLAYALIYGPQQFGKALERLEELASRYPKWPEVRFARGVAYQKGGQLNLAVADFNAALSYKSDLAEAAFSLAQCQYDLEHNDAAIAACTRTISICERASGRSEQTKSLWAGAYNLRACAHWRRKDLSQPRRLALAKADFEAALKVDPDYKLAQDNLERVTKPQAADDGGLTPIP